MLLPILSGSAIRQPLIQDPSVTGDSVTFLLRLTASLRARASDELMSVAIDFILWLLISSLKDGAAREARIAAMATTIISSVMVNPRIPTRGRLNFLRLDPIPIPYQAVAGVFVPAWLMVSVGSLFLFWVPVGAAVIVWVGGGPAAVLMVTL